MNYIARTNKYEKQLIKLLEYKIKKYNANFTSIININTANKINASNIYTLKLYIKDDLDMINNNDIIELYLKSKKNLDEIVTKTRMFYYTIFINNLLDINNYFYNSTLKEGIKGFFKIYDTDYSADEIKINADYEPFVCRPMTKGIIFIKEYLEYINYENIFCKKFDYKKIVNGINEDMFISIYEYIFTKLLLSTSINQNVYELTNININKMNNIINRKNLYKAYNKLKNMYNLDNLYYDKSADIIIEKIMLYKEKNILNKLIEEPDKIIYKENKRMTKNELDYIINNPTINNIKEIKSLYDLIELFDNVKLDSLIIHNIFTKLNLLDIMALKNYYSMSDSYILRELDIFIKELPLKKANIINNNYQQIEFE